jgi:hypothetical protein
MPSKGEAKVLLSLAKKELSNDRGDEALQAAKDALSVCNQISDAAGSFEASLAIASAYVTLDQLDDALRECESLVSKAVDGKGRSALALVKADALLAQGKASVAVDAAKEAAAAANDAQDEQLLAKALLAASKVRLRQGQSKPALQNAEKALSKFNELEDDSGEASAWLTVMSARLAAGSYEGGIAASCAAISLYGELGDQSGEARVLLKLADAQLKRRLFGEALASAVKALAHFQKCTGSKMEVVALDVAVKAYIGLGQALEASQVAKASVSTLRRLGKRKLEALAMLPLARAHAADQWLSEAVEVLNNAIDIFVQFGDKVAHGSALQLLAEINLNEGKLDDALQAGDKAVSTFKEAGNFDLEIQANQVVLSIKDALEKNPAMQSELAKKKEVQREMDMMLLNEVASALTQRNADDFKEKYEKLDRCETLSIEEISAVISPAMQVNYEETQEWVSSTLEGSKMRHRYNEPKLNYLLSRYGGMHYGPCFRLCALFGHTLPLDEMHWKYAVTQLCQEHRDGDWEEILCYHPPMYDCGLQAQMASNLTMYEETEKLKAADA